MRKLLLLVVAACSVAICEPGYSKSSLAREVGSRPPDAAIADALPTPEFRALSDEGQKRQSGEWKAFRSAFPYHIQTLAASAPYADGTRTLIVSEPPPHVTLEGVKALDPALRTTEVYQHTIGHDGWVKDIVINVPALNAEKFDSIIRLLSEYLFATSYGCYCLPLPIDEARLSEKYPYDVRIGVEELNGWLQRGIFNDAQGRRFEFANLEDADGHVLFERERGLVLWTIPDRASVDSRKADIRRFCLDSDLIIGAVKLPRGTIVVCGRERLVPISVMPPLRTETVCLLASAAANTAELAQSYERDTLLAGRLTDGWDWAPAFLSRELIDTEFGSLLNLADQLLKSWTEHGEVRYQNFPYPDPARFPFDKSLFQVLNVSSSLLFNWNTTGVGYVADLGEMKVYGLNRTGSLPVIYRPDEKEAGEKTPVTKRVIRAEEDGYDYFATRNDPILARVVQYTSLYQCFRSFQVSSGTPVASASGDTSPVMTRHLKAALTAMREAKPDKVREVARASTAHEVALVEDKNWGGTPGSVGTFNAAAETSSVVKEINELVSKLSEYQGKWKRDPVEHLANLGGASREKDGQGIPVPASMTDAEQKHLVRLFAELQSSQRALNAWANIPLVQREFSAAMGDGGSSWLHTQTVVVSCNIGESLGGIGGHNIDAEVTRFRASSEVAKGKVVRAGDGTILHHPDDVGKVPELVRLAAREKSNPRLLDMLSERVASTPARPAAPRGLALAFGDRPALPARRGFQSSEHVPSARGSGGGGSKPPYEPPPPHSPPPKKPPGPPFDNSPGNSAAPPSAHAEKWMSDVPDGLFVERRDGKICLYRLTSEGNAVAEVWNSADAVYSVLAEIRAGGRRLDSKPLRLSFGEGYSSKDADKFVRTLRLQAERLAVTRRVLLFEKLSPAGVERLATQVTKAKPAVFEVEATSNRVHISGRIELTDVNSASFGLGLKLDVSGPTSSATTARVNTIVNARTSKVGAGQPTRPLDLGTDIYNDLIKELSPHRRGSGKIIIDDAGDVQILLNDEPQRPDDHQACAVPLSRIFQSGFLVLSTR